MAKIETRTIALQTKTTRRAKTSVGSAKINKHHAHVERERREHHEYHYSGGVTRCSRCPPDRTGMPARFCPECANINRARHQAGLLRPAGDPRPSTDNIINPVVVGKYRGPGFHKRFKDSPQPVVTAFVEKCGRGWRRGVATLNGVRVYVGNKTQSHDAAWDYATHHQMLIKMGIQFENELIEKYGSLD